MQPESRALKSLCLQKIEQLSTHDENFCRVGCILMHPRLFEESLLVFEYFALTKLYQIGWCAVLLLNDPLYLLP